jgi:hypothetical protein
MITTQANDPEAALDFRALMSNVVYPLQFTEYWYAFG